MKITILIPCHNEEKSVAQCVRSCLLQSRKPDEIIVINDGSTDKTAEILASFGKQIRVITIPKATGNKSHAQEYGLKFVTGDVFIATDGDTTLDRNLVKIVEENFIEHPEITAVAGYVRSLKYNWLTACRALEYTIGQNLHKLAQHYIGFIFVIPGAVGAFRTKQFLDNITFEHDTLTEDLDFTYRFHKLGLKIHYDSRAIVFTQDPATLHSYINQVRRWFGGGWQCLLKHRGLILREPRFAMEISLLYLENIIFSALLFLVPLLSLQFYLYFVALYLVVAFICATFAAIKERRPALLLVPFPYFFLMYLNAYLFLEQMVKEAMLGQKKLTWFHPERVEIVNS